MSYPSLERMLSDYYDQNPSLLPDELLELNTVTFARQVYRNRPAVVRKFGKDLPCARWTASGLIERVTEPIEVAVTPDGRADSIVDGVFMEPSLERMHMAEFLNRLGNTTGDAVYFQSQNDCLSKDAALASLRPDAGDVAFATDFFGAEADAVNLWIGSDRSVTSLHSDPYENLYLCVSGRKTFILYPPAALFCMHIRPFHAGKWQRDATGHWSMSIRKSAMVPWIPLDPLVPDFESFPRFALAKPIHFTLEAGDMAYIPALWFHHVRQSGNPVIAVNWWYDMAYDSPVWQLHCMIRRLTVTLDGQAEEPGDENETAP